MLKEGIFLPRIRDVVKDLMSLLAQSGPEKDKVDSAVVDFVDACRTTSLHRKKTKTSSRFRGLEGAPIQRTTGLTILMLWWLLLGPDLSKAKAQ